MKKYVRIKRMKTLKTIQTLSKIGRILSKIVFIVCCVCFGFCLFGIPSLMLSAEILKIGDITVYNMIIKDANVSLSSMYNTLAVGAFSFACEAVVAKFAEVYFRRELKVGTPFTFEGSKELRRLGIISLSISVGYSAVVGIWQSIAVRLFSDVEKIGSFNFGVFGFGIAFLIVALLCRHGAELAGGVAVSGQTENK